MKLSAETYPREIGPHINLGGVYSMLGQHDKADVETREAFKINPEAAITYANLVADDLNLGRLSEAKSTAQ